jgi:hypothetical protein
MLKNGNFGASAKSYKYFDTIEKVFKIFGNRFRQFHTFLLILPIKNRIFMDLKRQHKMSQLQNSFYNQSIKII